MLIEFEMDFDLGDFLDNVGWVVAKTEGERILLKSVVLFMDDKEIEMLHELKEETRQMIEAKVSDVADDLDPYWRG